MTVGNYYILLVAWIVFGLVIFIILLFVAAPYGRHTRRGWGPQIPNRLGWIFMELPSLLVFAWFFLAAGGKPEPVSWIFFVMWVAHYFHRSLLFPFMIKTRGKKMPLLIVMFAIFFNLVNGYFNGSYFSVFGRHYGAEWLTDPRFISGTIFFIAGAWINITSDQKLLRLRMSSNGEYRIPEGGLFNQVSCPNFFGEIVQWTGFALLTWSPAALAFALWTFFNLVPRALEHHRWYREKFSEYPEGRRAVIPGVL